MNKSELWRARRTGLCYYFHLPCSVHMFQKNEQGEKMHFSCDLSWAFIICCRRTLCNYQIFNGLLLSFQPLICCFFFIEHISQKIFLIINPPFQLLTCPLSRKRQLIHSVICTLLYDTIINGKWKRRWIVIKQSRLWAGYMDLNNACMVNCLVSS